MSAKAFKAALMAVMLGLLALIVVVRFFIGLILASDKNSATGLMEADRAMGWLMPLLGLLGVLLGGIHIEDAGSRRGFFITGILFSLALLVLPTFVTQYMGTFGAADMAAARRRGDNKLWLKRLVEVGVVAIGVVGLSLFWWARVGAGVLGEASPADPASPPAQPAARPASASAFHAMARSRLWWRRLLPWLAAASASAAFLVALVSSNARAASAAAGAAGAVALFAFVLYLPLREPFSREVSPLSWVAVLLMLAAGVALFAAAAAEDAGEMAAASGAAAFMAAVSSAFLTTSLAGRDSAWEVARAFVSRMGPLERFDEEVLKKLRGGQMIEQTLFHGPPRDFVRELQKHVEAQKDRPGARGELSGLYTVGANALQNATPQKLSRRKAERLMFGDAGEGTVERLREWYAGGRALDAEPQFAALRAVMRESYEVDPLADQPPRRKVREDVRREALQPWI